MRQPRLPDEPPDGGGYEWQDSDWPPPMMPCPSCGGLGGEHYADCPEDKEGPC